MFAGGDRRNPRHRAYPSGHAVTAGFQSDCDDGLELGWRLARILRDDMCPADLARALPRFAQALWQMP